MSDEIPTESPDQTFEKAKKKNPKKKSVTPITFARPVFATEFFTDDSKKKFDDLPQWQRHLIKRLVDHGDLKKASREAGVSRHVDENIDLKLAETKGMVQSLKDGGITTDKLVQALDECLAAESVKVDKHGNPFHFIDLKVKLQTINLICQLRGDFKESPDDSNKDKSKGIVDLFEDTKVEK